MTYILVMYMLFEYKHLLYGHLLNLKIQLYEDEVYMVSQARE